MAQLKPVPVQPVLLPAVPLVCPLVALLLVLQVPLQVAPAQVVRPPTPVNL